MAPATKSHLVPWAIPYKGMSTRFPIAAMPPEYSPWIRDMDNEGGYYECRKGVKWKFNAVSNYISALAPHPTDKNKLIALDTWSGGVEAAIYDWVTDTKTHDFGISATGGDPRARAFNFMKNAYFFFNDGVPVRFDGTSWFTTVIGSPGPVAADVRFGFPYKRRLWVVDKNGGIWYTPSVEVLQGEFALWDISSLTKDAGVAMCAFGFTLSSGLGSEELLGVVYDTGEVIVYSGNYPDDPANWQIAGRARIGSPLGYQSIIEMNGDVLVKTKNAIVSMRELLTTAQGNVQAASITFEIEKYWVQLIDEIQAHETLTSWTPSSSLISFINGVYHQQRNKIVVFFPGALLPHTVSSKLVGYSYEELNCALVYDIPTQAWTVHILDLVQTGSQLISSYYWPTFNALMFGTNSTTEEACWQYWGENTYRDNLLYDTDFRSLFPQIHTPFHQSDYISDYKGTFVTHEGQFSKGQATIEIVADSGASASNQQHSNAPAGAPVSRDWFGGGAVGESFQVRLSTSTDVAGTMDKPYRVVDIDSVIEPSGSVF